MPTLDIDFVRNQFPAFSEPSLKDWAFFDNAGGSYTCQQVIKRLTSYYTETKVQPYHPYPTAQKAGKALDTSYRALAAYLNVGEDEVHLGPSTSQNTYVLAHAFKTLLQEGDEIIVTNQDHEANSGCWRQLAGEGIIVREWKVDPDTGALNLEQLDSLLTDKTRIVAYPHCSNIVAYWNPVEEINRRIRRVGAVSIVDGVAAAPHGLPDIGALGADIYLFSLYKTWGPHLGLMTIKRTLMEKLSNQGHYFHDDLPRKRLLPAGPDHAQIAAAAGILDYLNAIHDHHFETNVTVPEHRSAVNQLIKTHENGLTQPLLDWLMKRDDIRLLGSGVADDRAPTVSILPLRKTLPNVQTILTEHKLMTGVAHFYAPRLLEAMNISPDVGVLRLSFLHYTTGRDMEQLIEGLAAALGS